MTVKNFFVVLIVMVFMSTCSAWSAEETSGTATKSPPKKKSYAERYKEFYAKDGYSKRYKEYFKPENYKKSYRNKNAPRIGNTRDRKERLEKARIEAQTEKNEQQKNKRINNSPEQTPGIYSVGKIKYRIGPKVRNNRNRNNQKPNVEQPQLGNTAQNKETANTTYQNRYQQNRALQSQQRQNGYAPWLRTNSFVPSGQVKTGRSMTPGQLPYNPGQLPGEHGSGDSPNNQVMNATSTVKINARQNRTSVSQGGLFAGTQTKANELLFKRGQSAFQSKDYSKAQHTFTRLARINSENARIQFAHGISLFSIGDYDKASKVLNHGLQLHHEQQLEEPFDPASFYPSVKEFQLQLMRLNNYTKRRPKDKTAIELGEMLNAISDVMKQNNTHSE